MPYHQIYPRLVLYQLIRRCLQHSQVFQIISINRQNTLALRQRLGYRSFLAHLIDCLLLDEYGTLIVSKKHSLDVTQLIWVLVFLVDNVEI